MTESQQQSNKVRCRGKTVLGGRCTRDVPEGKEFCWQHKYSRRNGRGLKNCFIQGGALASLIAIPLAVFFFCIGPSREAQVRSEKMQETTHDTIDQILILLENELNLKGEVTQVLHALVEGTPSISPSGKAKELAGKISEEDSTYAQALKAIAESRFDEARRLIEVVEREKEIALSKVYHTRATIEYYAENHDQAIEYCERAIRLIPDNKNTLLLAHICYNSGDSERALSLFIKVLGIDKSMEVERDVSLTVMAYYGIAKIYFEEEDYEKSQKAISRLILFLRKAEAAGLPVSSTISELEQNLAYVLCNMGNVDEAVKLVKSVLGRIAKDSAATYPASQELTPIFLRSRLRLGVHANAESFLKLDLSFAEKAHGAHSWAYRRASYYLAKYYAHFHRWKEAVAVYEQGIAIIEKMDEQPKQALAFLLDKLSVVYTQMGRFEAAATAVRKTRRVYESLYGTEHSTVAETLRQEASLYEKMGRFGEAESIFTQALVLSEKVHGVEHDAVMKVLQEKASLYQKMDRFTEAEALYKRGLVIIGNMETQDTVKRATCEFGLVALYMRVDRFEDAESLFKQAVNGSVEVDALKGSERIFMSVYLFLKGVLYQRMDRFGEAETFLKRVLATFEDAHEAENALVGSAEIMLGRIYYKTDRVNEAESMVKRGLSSLARGHDSDAFYTALASYILGAVYLETDRFEEAEGVITEALRSHEKACGEGLFELTRQASWMVWLLQKAGRTEEAEALAIHALNSAKNVGWREYSVVGEVLHELGSTYRKMGRLEESESHLKEAVRIAEKVYGPEHSAVATYMNNLAVTYQKMDRLEEAEVLFREAMRIAREAYGQQHGEVCDYMGNLGGLYTKVQRFEEAEALFKEAITVAEQVYGEEHSTVADHMKKLASLYEETDRLEDAKALYRKAVQILMAVYGADHSKTISAQKSLDAMKV